MKYKQLSIDVPDQALAEVLIARLGDIGFDGFEEVAGNLLAYVSEDIFDENEVKSIFSEYGLSYLLNDIEEQNWNAQWEESFQPVFVPGFCTVRAHFHDISVGTPYEIIITPQMSFGTGHHATTMLMMRQMQHIDMAAKTVLDFGTGTGILAILAEKLGAEKVLAIDNDAWSYENAQDNMQRNSCVGTKVQQGSLEDVEGKFDIILANINRNILLSYMDSLSEHITGGGFILMSGLLTTDADVIISAALSAGLNLQHKDELDNWVVLLFKK